MTVPRPPRFLNSKTTLRLSCHALSYLLLAFFLMSDTYAQTQPTQKALRLGKIEAVGLERYTHEQLVTASGLQIGQLIDIPAVDEAANQLVSSGLFKMLSYR